MVKNIVRRNPNDFAVSNFKKRRQPINKYIGETNPFCKEITPCDIKDYGNMPAIGREQNEPNTATVYPIANIVAPQ
ncbi:MAG: hypothetical protein JW763_04255 [candidate division Zixibacteria bacterium]|nr:hypothetical protein [candidate division Zixibacteria bacterium]